MLTSPNESNSPGEPRAAVVSLSLQFQFYYKAFLWGEKDGDRPQLLGICQVFSHSLVGYYFISFDERQNQHSKPIKSICFDSHRAWLIIAICSFNLKLNRISKLLMHRFCCPMIWGEDWPSHFRSLWNKATRDALLPFPA